MFRADRRTTTAGPARSRDAAGSTRGPRDLVGAVWGLAFLVVASLGGWVSLGHHLDPDLLARWGPLALIALGLLLALASLRRR